MTDNKLPPGYIPLTAHTFNNASGSDQRGRGSNGSGGRRQERGMRDAENGHGRASKSTRRGKPGGRGRRPQQRRDAQDSVE